MAALQLRVFNKSLVGDDEVAIDPVGGGVRPGEVALLNRVPDRRVGVEEGTGNGEQGTEEREKRRGKNSASPFARLREILEDVRRGLPPQAQDALFQRPESYQRECQRFHRRKDDLCAIRCSRNGWFLCSFPLLLVNSSQGQLVKGNRLLGGPPSGKPRKVRLSVKKTLCLEFPFVKILRQTNDAPQGVYAGRGKPTASPYRARLREILEDVRRELLLPDSQFLMRSSSDKL